MGRTRRGDEQTKSSLEKRVLYFTAQSSSKEPTEDPPRRTPCPETTPLQKIKNGPEKDQQRAPGPGSRPPGPVQRGSRRGRLISLAGHHHGPAGIAVPGGRLFPHHSLSHGLPLQTAQGGVHNAHIPPEHKLKRLDLPRHPEVAVVPGADHIEGVALNLLAPLRPQPRRPPRPGDRQDFQNRQGEVLRVGAGVDQKIRNVNLAPSPPPLTRATTSVPDNNQFVLSPRLKMRTTTQSKSRDITPIRRPAHTPFLAKAPTSY